MICKLSKDWRYEFKYLMPQAKIGLLGSMMKNYLTPDIYGGPTGSYKVFSVYLDTPDLFCYRQKFNGDYFRKKYRLRYYHDRENYFFELKRKKKDLFYKERTRLEITDEFVVRDVQRLVNAMQDLGLRAEVRADLARLNLQPRLEIVFSRMAFNYPGAGLRITIDQDIDYRSMITGRQTSAGRLAILEIKGGPSLPGWFGYLMQRTSLRRTAFSKYAYGIELLSSWGYNRITL